MVHAFPTNYSALSMDNIDRHKHSFCTYSGEYIIGFLTNIYAQHCTYSVEYIIGLLRLINYIHSK